MPFGSEDDKGATGAAKFVTSTVGNTVGGLGKTVGGVVGAGGRGIGQTVTAATGSAGKPVGEAIESLGNGVENGANNISDPIRAAEEVASRDTRSDHNPSPSRDNSRPNPPSDSLDPAMSSNAGSESDVKPYRPLKRRRHNQEEPTPLTNSESSRDDDAEVRNTDQDPRQGKENDDPDAAKAKKPKYRIHIPTNTSMPEDTFLTQPPSRSPSPYRIDKFCWQKPKNYPIPPKSKTQQIIELAQVYPQSKARAPLLSRSPDPSATSISHTRSSGASIDAGKPIEEDGPTPPAIPMSDQPDDCYDNILGDLPSDAFSSPEPPASGRSDKPIAISSQNHDVDESSSQFHRQQRIAAPMSNLRQTTLFGDHAHDSGTPTQPTRKRNWSLANREEPPTHHKLDRDAMKTWVYPTNLGKIREYQYSIVGKGLYNNTLVALPTGLGKTFIAATVMLNWFRWTKDAQLVFVAPTRPLVSQQVKACFEIAGIPRSTTTMLTGATPPGVRAEEWRSKRVFFMTPQTIVNDLKTGICDPKKLVLLVVDEAHRATGGYAYVEVVQFLRRFNQSFRVLALTATPGSSIEGVQEVIDGLGISRIEIRTEESIDIRQYVHARKVETKLFDNSEEMVKIMDLFAKALQPLVDKLCTMNAYWGRDPMSLTPYGCNQARTRWMASDPGRKANMGIKGMVNTIFSVLASLAHGIELLKFHGIGPFYHKALSFRNETRDAGNKGSKYRRQIDEDENFQKMMSRMQLWINSADFIGHPKLEYLQGVVLGHFLDAGEGRGATAPSSTRIMVFAHYRDSAEEIARVLKRHDPMVRPRVFVGQANSKGSEGMDQKTQLDVIQKFQSGIYNTLVATSIGEEGLDIGEVDLIICFDASASPIRMLQRMGRTGRKRAGKIVVTLMRGKEENNFIKAKDNYEKMQVEIASGVRFDFRDDQSQRIVPRDIQPAVDKRVVEIPFENTQADLPEPSKRAKVPKRPPKKFHMPDGVRKGFVKASRLDGSDTSEEQDDAATAQLGRRSESLESLPSLHDVLLSSAAQKELDRTYRDTFTDIPEFVKKPRLDAFPTIQRKARPTRLISHGRTSERFAHMLATMYSVKNGGGEDFERSLHPDDRLEILSQAERRTSYIANPAKSHSNRRASKHPAVEDSTVLGDSPSVSQRSSPIHEPAIGHGGGYNSDADQQDPTDGSSTTAFSPQPKCIRPSIRHQRACKESEAGSEDDLPDFSTLIKRSGRAPLADVVERTKGAALPRLQPRKRRKVVFDDDSDEA
ncbi:hypothetical protein Q9189_006496 [Teloschistes chrysophthalmus]